MNLKELACMKIKTYLQAIGNEIPGVIQQQETENLHRMRVSSRRLREAIQIFSLYLSKEITNLLQRKVKKLTKTLRSARDKDVQLDCVNNFLENIAENGIKNDIFIFLTFLKQERAKLQKKVVKELIQIEQEKLLFNIEQNLEDTRSEIPIPLLIDTIIAKTRELLLYELYIYNAREKEKLHAMRIAAKHLRYTLEILEPVHPKLFQSVIKILKKIQTFLGDIHDCDVWSSDLQKYLKLNPLAKNGINYFLEDRQKYRSQKYKSFISLWNKLREKNFWEEFMLKLKNP